VGLGRRLVTGASPTPLLVLLGDQLEQARNVAELVQRSSISCAPRASSADEGVRSFAHPRAAF